MELSAKGSQTVWRLNFSDKMRPLIFLNVDFRSAAEMAQQVVDPRGVGMKTFQTH